MAYVGPNTALTILQGSGTGKTPSYSTATYPATTTVNQLLYSSSANVVAGLATVTTAVLTTAAGVPTWAAELSLALGGTNANLTASNGGIFYSTASAGAILSGTATARQMLQSGASTTPAWSTATYPATTTANDILYSSSANVVGQITTANNGVLITSAGGVPSLLANGTTGQILTATTGSPPSWGPAPSAGITTIDGDSGSITGSTVTIYANNATQNCGSTVLFVNSGTTSTLNVTDSNINTMIGIKAGSSIVASGQNTALGAYACQYMTNGSSVVAIGLGALQAATAPSGDVAIGFAALGSGNLNAAGTKNVGIGYAAAQYTTAGDNIAIGAQALGANTTGNANLAIGSSALFTHTASIANIAIGYRALQADTSGIYNIALGYGSLETTSTAGQYNIAIGYQALQTTTGSNNIGIGADAIYTLTSGSNCTCVGFEAGFSYTSSESNNICLGANVFGTAAESNVIRLGNSSNTKCFITGITGVTASNAQLVTINSSTSQMGVATYVPGGTWTPNLQINGSSTGITYSIQTGTYVQIGNMVFITCYILLSSKGASTGNVTISNLPVTLGTVAGGNQAIPINFFNGWTSVGYSSLSMSFTASTTVGGLFCSGSGVGVTAVTNTQISNTFAIVLAASYSVA
jgi:hypothetical protein